MCRPITRHKLFEVHSVIFGVFPGHMCWGKVPESSLFGLIDLFRLSPLLYKDKKVGDVVIVKDVTPVLC